MKDRRSVDGWMKHDGTKIARWRKRGLGEHVHEREKYNSVMRGRRGGGRGRTAVCN